MRALAAVQFWMFRKMIEREVERLRPQMATGKGYLVAIAIRSSCVRDPRGAFLQLVDGGKSYVFGEGASSEVFRRFKNTHFMTEENCSLWNVLTGRGRQSQLMPVYVKN